MTAAAVEATTTRRGRSERRRNTPARWFRAPVNIGSQPRGHGRRHSVQVSVTQVGGKSSILIVASKKMRLIVNIDGFYEPVRKSGQIRLGTVDQQQQIINHKGNSNESLTRDIQILI